MSAFTPLRTAAHNALRLASRAPRATPSTTLTRAQPLSTTAARRAYKDDQDRTSVKPRAHEYSGSGTDEQAANNPDAAFNPDKTRPEQALHTAGQGNQKADSTNPLDVSPANKDVSTAGQGAMEDKPQQGSKDRKSGGGATTANKGGGSGQ